MIGPQYKFYQRAFLFKFPYLSKYIIIITWLLILLVFSLVVFYFTLWLRAFPQQLPMTIILVALSFLNNLGRENLLIDFWQLFLHRAELSLGLSKVGAVEEPGEERKISSVRTFHLTDRDINWILSTGQSQGRISKNRNRDRDSPLSLSVLRTIKTNDSML